MPPVILPRAIRCILPKKDRCFWFSPSSTNCSAGGPRDPPMSSRDLTDPAYPQLRRRRLQAQREILPASTLKISPDPTVPENAAGSAPGIQACHSVARAAVAQYLPVAILNGGGGLAEQGVFHPAVEHNLRGWKRGSFSARAQHRREFCRGLAAGRRHRNCEFGGFALDRVAPM